MNFQSKTNEKLFVSTVVPGQDFAFEKDIKKGLTIVWNLEGDARFTVDNKEVVVGKDCIIFLTEFHQVDHFVFGSPYYETFFLHFEDH